VVIRSKRPSGLRLTDQELRVDVCCADAAAAAGSGAHTTVNPAASNGGALLPLLMLALALACVVALGRVPSVCFYTCVACCCCGHGGSFADAALASAPPLSAAHSVYFLGIRMKAFFLGHGRGGKAGIGLELCRAWRKRMIRLNSFLTGLNFSGRKGLLPGRDWAKRTRPY
jgi:hypothetical protein